MRTFLPFMCTALVIHTASMATEGMLLAGARQSLSRLSLAAAPAALKRKLRLCTQCHYNTALACYIPMLSLSILCSLLHPTSITLGGKT